MQFRENWLPALCGHDSINFLLIKWFCLVFFIYKILFGSQDCVLFWMHETSRCDLLMTVTAAEAGVNLK
jgi:hypothetical protein